MRHRGSVTCALMGERAFGTSCLLFTPWSVPATLPKPSHRGSRIHMSSASLDATTMLTLYDCYSRSHVIPTWEPYLLSGLDANIPGRHLLQKQCNALAVHRSLSTFRNTGALEPASSMARLCLGASAQG